MVSVAIPRLRKSSSHSGNSSLTDSVPGMSSASGGRAIPAGRRRLPTTRCPSKGTSIRSKVGSIWWSPAATASTLRTVRSR